MPGCKIRCKSPGRGVVGVSERPRVSRTG
jgi:hypothetical protein